MPARLLSYQIRLASRSIRRNPGLSTIIVVGLALVTAIWGTTMSHYLRAYAPRPSLSPHLHQVELPHSRTLARLFAGSNAEPAAWASRTRVSFPEYQLLSGSDVPARQAGAVRSRLLVSEGGQPAQIAIGRFVTPDFFGMFQIPVRQGQPFTRADDGRGEAVVVLGHRSNLRLFGNEPSVGRAVLIEGVSFRVVGVIDGDQPFRPEWDLAAAGLTQDALYLPFSWFQRLRADPEGVVQGSPSGPAFEDLLGSDGVFAIHWIELTTPEALAAYRAHLARVFGARGIAYQLRSYPDWVAAFPVPDSTIRFFTLLTFMLLVAGAFNIARLLLAKGLARRDELGVHRALGATRASLFVRQMVEAALLALPGTVLGLLLSVLYNWLFDVLVADNDIPVRYTPLVLTLSLGAGLLTGLAAALYPAWRLSRLPPTVAFGSR